MGDVGLRSWVPLARFDGPPEQVVSGCRARIDPADAGIGPIDHENLLAVTQFLLPLGSGVNCAIACIIRGREAAFESPLYQEVIEEAERTGETRAMQRAILRAVYRV
jgi:hypothetical protein